jgi:hypothetical protein
MSRMRITGSKRSEYDDKGILNLVQKEKSAENEKASSHYSVCCVFATPSFSEGIPIEYQGIWCYVGKESTGEMQLYHKAQKMCRENRERVMTVKRFGLIVSNKGSTKAFCVLLHEILHTELQTLVLISRWIVGLTIIHRL